MLQLAAVLRPRRDGADRLVDHRLPDHRPGCKALILPSITLGLFQLTLIMRLVRSEMLEVMRTDYIKFAPRPRASPTAPSISAMRSRTRWCR